MINIGKISITTITLILGIVLFFYLTSMIFKILLPIILILIIYFIWKYQSNQSKTDDNKNI
jgi:hypothetical protein